MLFYAIFFCDKLHILLLSSGGIKLPDSHINNFLPKFCAQQLKSFHKRYKNLMIITTFYFQQAAD